MTTAAVADTRITAALRHALHELRWVRWGLGREWAPADGPGPSTVELMIEAELRAAGLRCTGVAEPGEVDMQHHGDTCEIHEACSRAECTLHLEAARRPMTELVDAREWV